MRSCLFLPVGDDRLLQSKLYRWGAQHAEFLILDLEDSLPKEQKERGRQKLKSAVELFKPFNRRISVRINNDQNLRLDCLAVRECGITEVLVPKCESPRLLEEVAGLLGAESPSNAEAMASIYPMIESPVGLFGFQALLDGRIPFSTVFFGCEDFANSLGVLEPSLLNTLLAVQSLIYQSAARGIAVIGSHARFSAFSAQVIGEYRQMVQESRSIGFAGTFAVHPKQVPIINEIYRYSAERLHMQKVLRFGQEREQATAVFSHEGRMYGPPMLKRFRRLIDDNS